jgi:hypothetical protein
VGRRDLESELGCPFLESTDHGTDLCVAINWALELIAGAESAMVVRASVLFNQSEDAKQERRALKATLESTSWLA